MGRKNQIKCNGDEKRFEEVADFIHKRFGNSIKYEIVNFNFKSPKNIGILTYK